MSTFTTFNGPQYGAGPSTTSIIELVKAYSDVKTALDEHLRGNVDDGSSVHNVRSYIDDIEDKLTALIAAKADSSDVDAALQLIDKTGAGGSNSSLVQAVLDLQKSDAAKAGASDLAALKNMADDSALVGALKSVQEAVTGKASADTVSGLSEKVAAFSDKLDTFYKYYAYSDGTHGFTGTVRVSDGVRAEYVDAGDHTVYGTWRKVSAQFAGTGDSETTSNNGLFVIGALPDTWNGGDYPAVSRFMSGRAYVKYEDEHPFDSIVDYTVTYDGDKYVGSLSQSTSRQKNSWNNLSFHLVVGTSSGGNKHVYLCVSADDLYGTAVSSAGVTGYNVSNLEFYAAGENFIPAGAAGWKDMNGVSSVSDIITSDNLDSTLTQGISANRVIDFRDWPENTLSDDNYVTVVQAEDTSLPVTTDGGNPQFIIAKASSIMTDSDADTFSKSGTLYVKYDADAGSNKSFAAVVDYTVTKTANALNETGDDGAVTYTPAKYRGTITARVAREPGMWKNLSFHLCSANSGTSGEHDGDVYITMSADTLTSGGVIVADSSSEPITLYMCGVNCQPFSLWSSDGHASTVNVIKTYNRDRPVYGEGDEEILYVTSRPYIAVKNEDDETEISPVMTLRDITYAAAPVGTVMWWPKFEALTKQNVIDAGLEDWYAEMYGELWAEVDSADVVSRFAVDVPSGWHACDGSTFTDTDWPELAEALGGLTFPVQDMSIIKARLYEDISVQSPDIAELPTHEKLALDIADEKAARIAADNTLQANIDAETASRESDVTTLQSNIDTEAATREEADNTLQSNIDNEASTREEADNTLQANIDNEASTREAADNTLQSNIDAEAAVREAADNTLQSNIDAEAATREAADAELQSNIDSTDSAAAALTARVTAIDGDGEDTGRLYEAEQATSGLTTRLYGADGTGNSTGTLHDISSNINGTITAVQRQVFGYTDDDGVAHDGLKQELQSNIDTEAATRASADSTLQANIDTETSARAAADAELQANIDAEAAAREAADSSSAGNVAALTARMTAVDGEGGSVATLTAAVEANAGNISANANDISNIKVRTGDLEDRMTAVDDEQNGSINGLHVSIVRVEGKADQNAEDIGDLDSRLSKLEESGN